ncbi:SURF1 family protein [Parachitinimonas caeni]|uniref:SURF1-like protein n=1 Tax=Parachitinimonas caeni TaxID=3031301 RepID=A0ABT7DVA4_9NEIS|nr:SURF1 family protein [Parachitinimonas caeni]MDK2123996.1 SURF1 family protein [Parachitinimonas caeni]
MKLSVIRPRPIMVLALVCVVAVTAWLSKWQFSRASYKQQLFQAQVVARSIPPSVWHGERGSEYQFRRFVLNGHWIRDQTIYLDNKIFRGTAGYWVVQPFQLTGNGRLVPIVRGWLPRQSGKPEWRGRDVVGNVAIQTRLIGAENKPYMLTPENRNGDIWQHFEFDQYRQKIGSDLEHVFMQEVAEEHDGLTRQWEDPKSDEAKHLGYALQWFFLGCVALIIFMKFHVKLDR